MNSAEKLHAAVNNKKTGKKCQQRPRHSELFTQKSAANKLSQNDRLMPQTQLPVRKLVGWTD